MLSIQAINLTKAFGTFIAVHQLNLEVKQGEIFGLVGPDASGKTTTLRMLCGILPPDRGEARVGGLDIRRDRELIKEKVGYLPQRFGLYGDLTVLENIQFYADLYQVSQKERRERITRLLRFANLEPFVRRKAQDLSGGMRQKLGLICALVHTPQILLLDEPTTGVDPLSRRDFWVILYELLKEGVTILFSTSYLDEAERCNRVGLIHQGELLVTETPGEIKARIKGNILELRTANNQQTIRALEGLEGVKSIVLSGDKIHLLVDRVEEGVRMVQDRMKKLKIEVLGLMVVRPTLEDAFVSIVRERNK